MSKAIPEPTPCPAGLFAEDGLAGTVLRMDIPGLAENLCRTQWYESDDGTWDSGTLTELPPYSPGGKELCAARQHGRIGIGYIVLNDVKSIHSPGISMCLCSLEATQSEIKLLIRYIFPNKRSRINWFKFREICSRRYCITTTELAKITPSELLLHHQEWISKSVVPKRAELLASYKRTRPRVSERQIYEAQNRPASKPEWYQWKKGVLSEDSKTTRRIERFLNRLERPVRAPK